jgi:ribose 5-phosphate isomerase B
MGTMIILATDHAGFQYKEALKKHLEASGHEVKDMGTDSEESCDYPEFMISAAREVVKDPENNKGIIFGGSGQGEAMSANRIKGVRATVFYGGPPEVSAQILELSKEHNNANMLSIGARFMTEEEMIAAVDKWLAHDFPGDERHVRRIRKIDDLS